MLLRIFAISRCPPICHKASLNLMQPGYTVHICPSVYVLPRSTPFHAEQQILSFCVTFSCMDGVGSQTERLFAFFSRLKVRILKASLTSPWGTGSWFIQRNLQHFSRMKPLYSPRDWRHFCVIPAQARIQKGFQSSRLPPGPKEQAQSSLDCCFRSSDIFPPSIRLI